MSREYHIEFASVDDKDTWKRLTPLSEYNAKRYGLEPAEYYTAALAAFESAKAISAFWVVGTSFRVVRVDVTVMDHTVFTK